VLRDAVRAPTDVRFDGRGPMARCLVGSSEDREAPLRQLVRERDVAYPLVLCGAHEDILESRERAERIAPDSKQFAFPRIAPRGPLFTRSRRWLATSSLWLKFRLPCDFGVAVNQVEIATVFR